MAAKIIFQTTESRETKFGIKMYDQELVTRNGENLPYGGAAPGSGAYLYHGGAVHQKV